MFGLGTSELLIVLAIVVLIFGTSRIPQVGRALREFKKEISGDDEPKTKGSIEQRSADDDQAETYDVRRADES